VLRTRRADTADLRAWAERIALRRGKRTAVVALARRLAGILYAMWRDETAYGATRQRTTDSQVGASPAREAA